MSSQPASMPPDAPAPPPISWEGDRMFNIYIYDYCHKRGFRRTAKELMSEADISPDATPPINARQGLLFEWWSVFWVLFQAKSNGGNSDDAAVYINHQNLQRQQIQRGQAPAPLPPLTPYAPPQQQLARIPNGMASGSMQPAMNRPPPQYTTNGALPNGINPTVGGQPQPQQGQPMPTPMNFGGMGGHPPQQNGMPNPGAGPSGPPPQQQPQQMTFAMVPNNQPRPPPSMMNGIPPPQRGPNANGASFQGSPTMAHSPQHNTGVPGHHGQPGQPGQSQPGQPQQQQGGPGQQAPMAQLGPSPHVSAMRPGSMLPPNGGPGMGPMNPGQPQQQQQGPPTPGYQQQQQQQHNPGGRPPSRTTTPRGGMMSHPSPSMAARQTPGIPGGVPPGMGSGGQGQGMVGMPPGMTGIGSMLGSDMNQEIMQIPQNTLNALKQELAIGDKDMSNLSTTEKSRILNAWKSRMGPGGQIPQRKDGPGPSGMMQAPGQPGQQQQQLRHGGPGGPGGPQVPQQRGKRSSTSPGEEHESLPRNESSPPDRKRARTSPGEPSAMAPIPYGHPGQQPPGQQQQQQQPHQQQPQLNQLHMMMQQHRHIGGMPMGVGGLPPPPQQQHQQHPGMPPPLGAPGMPGSMMQMGGGGVMMSPQQQQQQQQQQQIHQANQQAQQQAAQQQLYRNQPPGSAPQFSPLNRLQNKPSMSGMMPPPSPAMGNGPPKDANKDANNVNKGPGGGNPQPPNGQQQQQQPTHNPDGSPRNPPPGGPSGSGTAPATPVPSNQPTPQQQQQQQQQPPPPNHLSMMPTNLLGGGLGNDMSLFDPGSFMDGMGTTDFDPSALFRPDGDINFERDFGQWFNPDDALGAGLDLK